MMYYAGIGSRQTPKDVLDSIKTTAFILGKCGFVLRSGGADGADTAFQLGASSSEIWVPWENFNGSTSTLVPTDFHYEIASKYHPAWRNLRDSVKSLHARNVGQILGHDGSNPSKFVLCWTPDGCSHGSNTTKETGGTGQAIRIASAYGVPVINMKSNFWDSELRGIMEDLTSSKKSL